MEEFKEPDKLQHEFTVEEAVLEIKENDLELNVVIRREEVMNSILEKWIEKLNPQH